MVVVLDACSCCCWNYDDDDDVALSLVEKERDDSSLLFVDCAWSSAFEINYVLGNGGRRPCRHRYWSSFGSFWFLGRYEEEETRDASSFVGCAWSSSAFAVVVGNDGTRNSVRDNLE